MLQSIDHVNIVTENLDLMERFYCAALGFTVQRRATLSGEWVESVVELRGVKAEVVYLTLENGPRLELLSYVSPRTERPRGLDAANTPGLRHVAYRATDIDRVRSRLIAAGARDACDIQDVPIDQVKYEGGARKKLFYCKDPEGNLIEICSYA